MGLNRLKDFVDEGYVKGKNWISSVRKVPAIASVGGQWVDLSMTPGTPTIFMLPSNLRYYYLYLLYTSTFLFHL